jgi:enterochelin esterase-like enzyme
MRRRSLYWLLALVWIGIGLLGAYSYLYNYNEHRGFATVKRKPGVHPGRQLWVHFYSRSLRREADYLVYLPTGYDPMRRYPVFYLLHGLPGRPQAYIKIADIDVRLDNLLSERLTPPMLLVFPDGRINGDQHSDSEWANTRAGRFEDYVVDVVHDVDRRFATQADRDARVIAGYSAGAYGALNVALHHLDVFGSVQVWSGYFAETHSGAFAHATRSAIAANSPTDYVRELRTRLAAHPLHVFLDGGRSDHDTHRIVRMAAALKAAGATVGYALWPGGHDWQFWYAHLNQMLVLAGNDVLGVPGQAVPLAPTLPLLGSGHRGHRRTPARARRHRHHAARRAARPGHRRPAAHVAGQPAKRAALRHKRAVAAPITHPLPQVRPTRAAPPPRKVLGAARRGPATGPSTLELIGGLLLALVSAAAINLGFLLQHRGLSERVAAAGGAWPMLRSAIRSRSWLAGQALGWAGFAAQVTAVVIAPLSLVQAFAAGGLALSVPLAAGVFGHRISREQAIAVLLIAVGLASLPIALGGSGERLRPGALTISIAAALALAVVVGLSRATSSRAIAAGLFYGVADAAIKAISVRWGTDGAAALISGWTMLALIGTFGGFLAFQASLRDGSAVPAISLMTALATLVALSCGLLAFGESLGSSPVVVAAHLVAVALVLACVPTLAAAQTEMSSEDRQDAARRRLRARIRAALQSAHRATGSEQQGLDPWTRPGPPAPQHLTDAHISRHHKGNLGGNQQQDDAEDPGEGGSPQPRETGEHHTGQHAGR